MRLTDVDHNQKNMMRVVEFGRRVLEKTKTSLTAGQKILDLLWPLPPQNRLVNLLSTPKPLYKILHDVKIFIYKCIIHHYYKVTNQIIIFTNTISKLITEVL